MLKLKGQRMAAVCVGNPSSREIKTGRNMGLHWPTSLALLMNSRPIIDTAPKELDVISEKGT